MIPARALGLYRLLYFAWLSLYFGLFSNLRFPNPVFDWTLVRPGMFQFLPPDFFNPALYSAIYPIWILTLLLSCLGLFTAWATAAACLLGYWVLGSSFGNGLISHQDLVHFLVLLVFALSKSGSELSLDRSWRKINQTKDSLEYSAPIFLLRFIFVGVFFSAAIAKLTNGYAAGIFAGDTIDIFPRANFWFIAFPWRDSFTGLNVFMASSPWLAKFGSFSVLILMGLSPLLVLKRLRYFILAFLLLFQITATFALYIDFLISFLPLYFFWIPFKHEDVTPQEFAQQSKP